MNAKLIADIVDRQTVCKHLVDGEETGPRAWACRTLTYFAAPEEPGGQPVLKQVHFLGCEDATIPGSGGGGATGKIKYIGNIGYNLQTHSFQKRVDEYDLATGQVTEGQWVTIINGQCIAHSSVDHSSVIPSS